MKQKYYIYLHAIHAYAMIHMRRILTLLKYFQRPQENHIWYTSLRRSGELLSWDIYSKLLLKECPQDFVTFFAPGARFVRMRETQFQTRGDSPYDPREMRGDIIIEAEYEGQLFLIHVEWQSAKDEEMDERLLGYNYEATRLHKLNVLSVVIYLQAVNDVPQAPLDRALPYGRRMLWFDYESLELHRQLVEVFRQRNLDAFYALMLLCKDGATYDVLEEVLERLEKRQRKELISITRFFAGKVFTSIADRERLERRFAMLRDFLKDSWTFQETLEEGRVEGRVEGQRQSIEAVAQARFPDLLAFIKNQISPLTDGAKLQEILIGVGTAHSAEEIKQLFSTLQ